MSGRIKQSLWLLALGAVALVVACSPARIAESLSVLRDIQASDAPSGLKRATPPPWRETVTYRFEDHEYIGDIYGPGGADTPQAVTVLVPGVVPRGKDDPRLVALGRTLARAGFLVLVPDLANLRDLNI